MNTTPSKDNDLTTLRARVTELERNELEWRNRVGREMQNVTYHLVRADTAEQRNAELEAALRRVFSWYDANDGHLTTHFPTPVCRQMEEIRQALARAESAARKQGGARD